MYDTYMHWTLFGQIVIIIMIQVGGLGFMSVATVFSLLLGRRIGLKERELMQEAVNTLQVGGVVRLMRFIICGTLIAEGLGAILLSIRFIPEMGAARGIWNGIFHSVSAFCNAGFDLMGKKAAFSSLSFYYNDIYVNIIVMILIIVGGLGFIVWEDIWKNGARFSKYKLHSKIVLVTTAVLLIAGFAMYFIFEYNYTLKGMSTGEKLLCSAFQSATFRTAGFGTVDFSDLSPSMVIVASGLMIIGGSPGSTAGGFKTTTAAVLFLGTVSVIRKRKSVSVFNRRFEDNLLKKVSSIVFIYLFAAIFAVAVICAADGAELEAVMIEVFSAMGTVGLSMGLTPSLCLFSRLFITALMFFGRIGGLSIVIALAGGELEAPIEAPVEKISVG